MTDDKVAKDGYNDATMTLIKEAQTLGITLQECIEYFTRRWCSTLGLKELLDLLGDSEEASQDGPKLP